MGLRRFNPGPRGDHGPGGQPAGPPGDGRPAGGRSSPLIERSRDGGAPMMAFMSRPSLPSTALVLDGDHFSLADARRALDGEVEELRLAPAARRAIERSRGCVLALLDRGERIYGVNTG